jgi:hypothetical protein
MTDENAVRSFTTRPAVPGIAALLLVLGITVLLAGCSSRPDGAEIEAVQAAIERARQEDAGVWAPDELGAAEEALNAALTAIAGEEGKWFKSYDRAREFLARARDEAGGAAEAAIAGKARARADAEATITAAEGVLGEAQSRLDSAPAGRASRADRAMFRDDLESLPQQLEEARSQLAAGEVRSALDSATAVESAAVALLDRIEQSLQGRLELPPK